MFPYFIVFFLGVGITSLVAFLYVRRLTARYESEIGSAEYRGRVARSIELEEELGIPCS